MEHENWLELADVYALGSLDGEDLREFEAHLSIGCSQCRSRLRGTQGALASIPSALPAISPSASVKARLWERIDSDKPEYVFIHANEGTWIEVGPGILAKILNMDAERQRVTAMVRMAPGSGYADHEHAGVEEVLVLEGSCYCGGRLLRKGDYHRAEVGSVHLDTRTDEGSLMLVTAPIESQMFSA
ncbi:MAG: cupin domain-containing protein [Candidatus Binatia bacterium]